MFRASVSTMRMLGRGAVLSGDDDVLHGFRRHCLCDFFDQASVDVDDAHLVKPCELFVPASHLTTRMRRGIELLLGAHHEIFAILRFHSAPPLEVFCNASPHDAIESEGGTPNSVESDPAPAAAQF